MRVRTLETLTLTYVRGGIRMKLDKLTATQARVFIDDLKARARAGEPITTIKTERTQTLWLETTPEAARRVP